jgi:two-component system NtrC family sensor kinase
MSRVRVSSAELGSFLRRDALDMCDAAGLDVSVDLVARDGGRDLDARAADLFARLRAGRGSLEVLQRMAALGDLGAALLHEVRNVLTGVHGFSQVALARAAADAGPLEIITQETERAIELLSRYLDLSRSGEQRPVAIESRRLIESTLALVRHRFHMAGVRLVGDAGPTVLLSGRMEELQQVLINLLVNALDVSRPGSEVRLGAAIDRGASLDIRVSDQGPGIAPAHLARLFEPFFTTKPAGVGVGLGLAVSRGIVLRHGGTIEVDSAPGQGASFVVRLPIAADSEAAGEAELTAEGNRHR